MKRAASILVCVLLAGFLSGCRPPKYVKYYSEFEDYSCEVPWGWSVYFEKQGRDFYSYTFVGPFDADFYRGVPTLSVRWYAHNKLHMLPDGTVESYASVDDYIKRMLARVYGPERYMEQPIRRVSISGWEAKNFIVAAPVDVKPSSPFGVKRSRGDGRTAVLRKHAYVLLPMDTGFYAIIYPGTLDGFKRFEPQFNHMVNTFRVKTDGPFGERLR